MNLPVPPDTRKDCLAPECSSKAYGHGYCPTHLKRKREGRPLEGTRVSSCSYEGCSQKYYSTGYCKTHYNRNRAGIPMGAPFKRTRLALDEWSEWQLDLTGYVFRYRNTLQGRETQREHRKVMEDHIGRKLLPHENVHHKNGDRADNKLTNLELWSTSQPKGQRVIDKARWMIAYLEEIGFNTTDLSTQETEVLIAYET